MDQGIGTPETALQTWFVLRTSGGYNPSEYFSAHGLNFLNLVVGKNVVWNIGMLRSSFVLNQEAQFSARES